MAVKTPKSQSPPSRYEEIEDYFKSRPTRRKDSGDGKALINGLRSFRGGQTGIRTRFTDPEYIPALYSGKSEAIVKVISYSRGHRVKALLDYISRIDNEKKPDVECQDELSVEFKGDKGVLAVYDRWKKDFEKYPKRGLVRKKRDAAHIIMSSDCKHTNENAKKVLAAARETIARELGDKGYEYVSALHRDSDNLHVHFVIKCKNRFPGQPKLRLNPRELLQIRTRFARRLTELGLDHVATLQKDRPDIAVLVKQGVGQLERNERQFQRAMRRAAPTRNAFLYRKNAAKTIVRLRDQVKKQTAPSSEERRELLAALRSIERKVTKSRPGIENEIAASFREYSREFKELNKSIEQAYKLPRDKSKDRQRLDKIIEKDQKFLKSNLSLAMESIKADTTLPEQDKKDALFILSQYEKDMAQALDKGTFTYKKDMADFKKTDRITRRLVFGQAFGMADQFKNLNASVKEGMNIARIKPEGAVDRLHKSRQFEKTSNEIRNQVKIAREQIKTMDGMDPALKNIVLSDLRKFETRVFDRLHGRDKARKKRTTSRNSLAKMKASYAALKAQKPTSEEEKKKLEKRLAELEVSIRKEIASRKRTNRAKTAEDPRFKHLNQLKKELEKLEKQKPQTQAEKFLHAKMVQDISAAMRKEVYRINRTPEKTQDRAGQSKTGSAKKPFQKKPDRSR